MNPVSESNLVFNNSQDRNCIKCRNSNNAPPHQPFNSLCERKKYAGFTLLDMLFNVPLGNNSFHR